MFFLVRTVNGKRTILEVESRDGVDNFSTCIQDKEEVPLESELPEFFVKCDFADSKLYIQLSSVSGKKILFELESSNVIARVCSDPIFFSDFFEHQDFKEVTVQIFVKTEAMKMITIEVVSSDTKDNVKTKIQNTKRKSPDSLVSQFQPHRNFVDVRMLISIKTVTGKTVALEAESFDAVDNVRTCIQGKEEIPPQLAVSNSLLRRDHVKGTIEISVKRWTGKIITLDVEGTDTIDLVKTKIEDRLAIPSSRQHLIYAGKQLADECTLAEYNIHKGSTLFLIEKIVRQILTVERLDSAKTFTIEVNSFTTVNDVKNRIRSEEGIFPDQQRLFFEGKQLEAGKTVADCNLYNMCTVLLEVTRKRAAHPGVDSDRGEDSSSSKSGEDSVDSSSEEDSAGVEADSGEDSVDSKEDPA